MHKEKPKKEYTMRWPLDLLKMQKIQLMTWKPFLRRLVENSLTFVYILVSPLQRYTFVNCYLNSFV